MTVSNRGAIQSRRGRRSRSSTFGFGSINRAFHRSATLVRNAIDGHARVIATMAVNRGVAAAVGNVAVAAVAVVVAAVAVAVAAMASMTTSTQAGEQALTAMARTGAAAVAIAAVARAIAVAVAAVTSNGLLFTAQESDADNREENRDTQKHSSIHPKLLDVLQSTVTGSEHVCAVIAHSSPT